MIMKDIACIHPAAVSLETHRNIMSHDSVFLIMLFIILLEATITGSCCWKLGSRPLKQ